MVECAVCGEEMAAGELLEHIHAQHIGPYRHNYACGQCAFHSTDADALLSHANKKRHLPLQMNVTVRVYVNDLAEKIMRDSLGVTPKRAVKRKLEQESPGTRELRKKCKVCQRDTQKNESSFLQHVTRFHYNAQLICPFCPNVQRKTWKNLLKHVQKKHQKKAKKFSLADMQDASQLQDRVRECFKKKHRQVNKTPTQPEVQLWIDSTNEAVRCENQEESGKLTQASPGLQSAEDGTEAVCAISESSTKSKWDDMTEHDLVHKTSPPATNDSSDLALTMFSNCFPAEDPEKCALCLKVVGNTKSKRYIHVAICHHRKSLSCPYCTYQAFHNWYIGTHIRRHHPEVENKAFHPPEEWIKGFHDLERLCFPVRKRRPLYNTQSCFLQPEEPQQMATEVGLEPMPVKLTEPNEMQKTLKEKTETLPQPQLEPSSATRQDKPTRPHLHHLSSERKRDDPSVPRAAITCQLCEESIYSIWGLERHIWVSHLGKEEAIYRCSGCQAASHSIRFFRHQEPCPAQNLSARVTSDVCTEFKKCFYRCFPWTFVRDNFEMSFRETPTIKQET